MDLIVQTVNLWSHLSAARTVRVTKGACLQNNDAFYFLMNVKLMDRIRHGDECRPLCGAVDIDFQKFL